MATSEFDKDFGYLMPFLDKIATAASALSDSAARAEAARLVADEKERWQRIRQLLSGTTSAKENAAATRSQPVVDSSTAASTPAKPSFTVGSLRRKNDS